MKKEELIAEVSGLKRNNEVLERRDAESRKAFAMAFNWYEQTIYGGDQRFRTPSWTEIYVEIGKLLALRDFRDYEGNISEIEFAIEGMKKNWEKYFADKRDSLPTLDIEK